MHNRSTRLLLAVMAALSITGMTAMATAHPVTAQHSKKHRKHHHHGIPQHNGGDRDADNNGGPSDGDGGI